MSAFDAAREALDGGDTQAFVRLLDEHPDLVREHGDTNRNVLLAMTRDGELVRLLLDRGADPDAANVHGWTALHQAAYRDDRALAELLLAYGARDGLDARGEGGTPMAVALFWGHRHVTAVLAREPRNLRVAAGMGDLALVAELAGTPAAGARRGFYRPHSGFPEWRPTEDPQEVLDEALVWAAKADRAGAIELLAARGAAVDADVYRGTALHWAAACGRVAAIEMLVALGADPNVRGTFGGPDHGEGVTPLHLAAQAGRRSAVDALLAAGADPRVRDRLHAGTAAGWAAFGGHPNLAALLSER